MAFNIDLNYKTILITGGAGFIGSNIAFHIQDNFPNAHLIIFDCFRNNSTLTNEGLQSFGHYNNLIGFKGNIICGNINYKQDLELLNMYKFDYIFHQAAISDTRALNQELVFQTNVNSFYSLLAIAKKDGAAMVYASSAATYGSLKSPQVVGKESPENAYAYSKYAMDQIAYRLIQTETDISIVGLRYFNVYGIREFHKEKTSSMVTQLGLQILSNKQPRLFDNSNHIFRDSINIEDVVQANIKACKPKKNGVYNIGTGQPRSFQNIADILQQELGTNLETEYFPNPYKDYQMNTQAEITSSKEYLGFQPKISLEVGIKKYISEIKRLHLEFF